MNTQDILRRGGTKLDAVLDFSEYYDFELVQTFPISQIDAIIDYSEFYDYTLGDNTVDYIYYEKFPCLFHFLLTEDGCIMNTEDNCKLEYEQNGIM